LNGKGIIFRTCRNFACIQSHNIIRKARNFSNNWVWPDYYFASINLRSCWQTFTL